MQDHCRRLIESIEALLLEGVRIDRAVADYVVSTFSDASPQTLSAIMAEPSSPERDTLCELLFFPDEGMQVRLETLLETYAYNAADERVVAAALGHRAPEARFVFDEVRTPLRLRLPPEAAESLVARLKITVQIDPGLLQVIEEHVTAGLQQSVKVKLRNARRMPAERKRDFLGRFIEKQGSEPAFPEDLVFLLGILEEFDDRCDVYRALNEKKRICAVHLMRHQHLEERRQNENIETLLARGERIPYLDKSAVRETIDRIDRICIGVWGRTESIRDLVPVEERIEFGGIDDLKALVRRWGET